MYRMNVNLSVTRSLLLNVGSTELNSLIDLLLKRKQRERIFNSKSMSSPKSSAKQRSSFR